MGVHMVNMGVYTGTHGCTQAYMDVHIRADYNTSCLALVWRCMLVSVSCMKSCILNLKFRIQY